MRQTARNIIISACSLAVLVGAFMLTTAPSAIAASAVEQGKAVAFNRKKGNCLACHAMDDGTLPGNIGPPLISMKLRFPDRAVLRAQIWDATVNNPNTIMIPFGRNGVLSESEIDLIVDYIYTL
jgi:L-cysteine S-thiosulfotransferase